MQPIELWQRAAYSLIALVLSVAVHEFGHAWAANKLGDGLPASQGRLTLNPIRHADPIGTLLFPLIAIYSHLPLLGWGRPVMTNPAAYTKRISRNAGSVLVSVAGPAMNLVMVVVISLLLVAAAKLGYLNRELGLTVIDFLVKLNFTLLFFNLLPIPPLDGGAVLEWVLPRSMQGVIEFLNRWGFVILLGLMVTPLLGILMTPARYVSRAWINALIGVTGL